MKIVVAFVLCTVLGIAAGATLQHLHMQQAMEELLHKNVALQRALDEAQREAKRTEALVAQLREEAAPEESEVDVLAQEEQGSALPEDDENGDTSLEEDAADDTLMFDLAALLHLDEPLPRSVLESGQATAFAAAETGNGDGTAADENLSQAERENRRRAAAEQLRQDVLSYLNDLAAKSGNPQEQERLAALADFYDAVFDLRQELQQADTDPQREQIQEALRQDVSQMNQLLREQQEHMLRQAARRFGVKAPAKQRQFISALRRTYQTPFFSLAPQPKVPSAGTQQKAG